MKFFSLNLKFYCYILYYEFYKIYAENYSPADIYDQQSQILIEADSQNQIS